MDATRRRPGQPPKPCKEEDCDRPSRTRGWCVKHYSRVHAHGSPSASVLPTAAENRFLKMTKWGEPSSHRPDLGPCLLYLGADNGNGYGQFRYNNRNGYAHRYAWEREYGPIPDKLTIDHLCRVRCCVNVEHMELTERLENYLRGVATREQCPNGHDYTDGNTLYKLNRPGVRNCRICLEDSKKSSGLRRTQAFQGIPDQRPRYDLALRDRLVIEAVERRLTVGQAAEQLGCAYKYMDKLVGREARERGVANRRRHKGPIEFNGWTERKTRVAVRERSDGVCERCDQAAATDMHHRKNRSQSGKWHPANIVHLCALCHVEITGQPDDSKATGFTVTSMQDPAQIPVLRRGLFVYLADDCSITEAA